MASPKLENLIGLESLRFVREGINAPGVFIQFKFKQPSGLGVVRVHSHGEVTGFHKLIESAALQTLIKAIALSYYRDLVVPLIHELGTIQPHFHKMSSRTSRPIALRPQPHRPAIPRVHRPAYARKPSLEEWHTAQIRLRHDVVGHIRWVSAEFRASWEKRREAEGAGVRLPAGYTWVREHKRGTDDTSLSLQGEDLATHTLFRPPSRATEELATLLLETTGSA